MFLEAFRPRTGGKKMSLGKKTVASSFCIVLFCVHVCVYAYGYRVHIHSVLYRSEDKLWCRSLGTFHFHVGQLSHWPEALPHRTV